MPRQQTLKPSLVRVLVVDDDSMVLSSAVVMLEALGHSAVAASSGAEALDALLPDPGIEVLLTDQATPGMTGLELIEFVVKERRSPSVILASGFTHATMRIPAPLIQLQRPFSLDSLSTAFARNFRGSSQ